MTSSLFSALRSSTCSRPPSNALAGMERPLRVARSIEGPMNSMKEEALGSEHLKVAVVEDENVSSPVVRSRRTRYRMSDKSAERRRASSRVRLLRMFPQHQIGA